MATTIYTPAMLKGAGTRGVPEMAVGSSFTNTYSMDFDGVDEYMSTSLLIPSSYDDNFSISFWIKPDAYSGYTRKHPVAVSTAVTAIDQTVHIRAWPNDFKVRIVGSVGGTGGVGTTTLNDGSWHHIGYTYTYDASTTYYTVNIYVDGNSTPEVVASMRTTGGYQTRGLYSIGVLTNWNGTHYAGTQYPGLIDEISAWDTSLSTADIATLAGGPNDLTTALSTTPVAWWRMGDKASWDGTDWTLTDQGSGGNNVTSVNMEEEDRVTDIPS